MKSRVEYTSRNILWGYVSSILTIGLSFVCRTAFIHTVGVSYLGINGLFTSVLGVLSLTELGIGTAMNYSLYKPVAENNVEKIKSLMLVYKKAYRWIAVIVASLGILLLPFLNYLIIGVDEIRYVEVYYLIFLFNTVSSYFVSYKYSLVNADQKNYVITNITTIFNLLMHATQIISLLIFENYILYLIIQALVQLIQKIYTAFYINRKYPYLKEKDIEPLEINEKKRIIKDVKALVLHKVGEISVNQTDNIIISAFINVTTVGVVSNYTLITSTVNTFVNIAFNGTIGSLGNLFATSDKEKQYQVFRAMDFVDFWIFSFSSIAMLSLVQPFISLLWGREYTLPITVLVLIILNNYMLGQRITINNIKVAGGLFVHDKYLPIIQGVVNLLVSIVLASRWGLIGVYIGTIVSGIVPSFIRPYIVFKQLLKRSAARYYLEYIIRLLLTSVMALFCYFGTDVIMESLSWIRFFACVILVILGPNLIIFILYRKTNEFKYLASIIVGISNKLLRRGKGYE